MVNITQDLMGGEWAQACRRLTIDSDGWVRGGQIPTAIYKARKAADAADSSPTIHTVKALLTALLEVEHECQNYMHRLGQLRIHLGRTTDRAMEMLDSGDLPGHQGVEYHRDLSNNNLLERYARLYNLPKPGGSAA